MKRKLPPNPALIALYESGLSASAIAEKYKSTHTAVLNHLKESGCKMRSLSESHSLAYANGRRSVTVKSGKDHWLWKGGKDTRDYRKIIKKEKCDICDSRLNLCIHHKDFDHYNNIEKNLQVLCVSCHLRLHKKAYWDAVKEGKETPKSTGRSGWK